LVRRQSPYPMVKKVSSKKVKVAAAAAADAVAAATPSAPSTKASPKAAPEAAPAPASPKVKETAKKGKKRPAASQKQDAAEKNPKAASLMGCSVPPFSPPPPLFSSYSLPIFLLTTFQSSLTFA